MTTGKDLIDEPSHPLDAMKLKRMSQSLNVEFMFARSMFQAGDLTQKGHLLNRVAELIDQGYIQTTVGKNLGHINASNLRIAHQALESG